MSSENIQSEADYLASRVSEREPLEGRAWVKRDLEFWHRCTIERRDGLNVIVLLDNMDELTVPRDRVAQFQLEPGDLVFRHHWEGSIGGDPAMVISANSEAAEVEYPAALFGKAERYRHVLRDLRFYVDVPDAEWSIGARVFAYKKMQFSTPLHLLFPARVQEIQFGVCVLVEFLDARSAWVPTTLVEERLLHPGDVVYACTAYYTHAVYSDVWKKCRIVSITDNKYLVQDDDGNRFETARDLIAVLPAGYQMHDGRFERIPSVSLQDVAVGGDVHITRTERWQDAGIDPITREHIDAVIADDRELAWASTDWSNHRTRDGLAHRSTALLWRGNACFTWTGCEITCRQPTDEQLAKMIDIAMALDANVVNDDGEELH